MSQARCTRRVPTNHQPPTTNQPAPLSHSQQRPPLHPTTHQVDAGQHVPCRNPAGPSVANWLMTGHKGSLPICNVCRAIKLRLLLLPRTSPARSGGASSHACRAGCTCGGARADAGHFLHTAWLPAPSGDVVRACGRVLFCCPCKCMHACVRLKCLLKGARFGSDM